MFLLITRIFIYLLFIYVWIVYYPSPSFLHAGSTQNRVERVNENEYAETILGASLQNAKFLGDKIWQDQPINEKKEAMNFFEAEEYCNSLNLLNINEWTLPTIMDFKLLDTDMDKFSFRANPSSSIEFYFTRDQNPHNQNSIYIAKTHKIYPTFGTSLKNEKNSVRCVLNPNIYNKYQAHRKHVSLKKESLDGYLEAFLATGEKKYIREAIRIGRLQKEKAKIEETLYNFLGPLKIFDIKANKELFDETKTYDYDLKILRAILKSKNLKHKFSVAVKKDSKLKLKYNKYTIKIKFNLILTYKLIADNFLFGFDLTDSQNRKISAIYEFILTPNNNYSMSKISDFGEIFQASRSSFLFTYSNYIKSAKIEYDIISTKISYYK